MGGKQGKEKKNGILPKRKFLSAEKKTKYLGNTSFWGSLPKFSTGYFRKENSFLSKRKLNIYFSADKDT